ncbi:MAG TPA: hypothetical protein VF498_00030 [Anaerolineales bacterium]
MSMYFPSSATGNGQEISRLLTAAVVNQKFRKLLLNSPAAALASGYNGEPFRLATEEKNLVLSIRAQSLADFARQLADTNNKKGRASRIS